MWRPRRPRRRGTPATLTADQWLTALRRVVDGATINHAHVIRHEPAPPITGGVVTIFRDDRAVAWTGNIYPGRGALTSLDVPLHSIDQRFDRAERMRFEFRWER